MEGEVTKCFVSNHLEGHQVLDDMLMKFVAFWSTVGEMLENLKGNLRIFVGIFGECWWDLLEF